MLTSNHQAPGNSHFRNYAAEVCKQKWLSDKAQPDLPVRVASYLCLLNALACFKRPCNLCIYSIQRGLFCQGAAGGGAGSPVKAKAKVGLVLPQGCSCLQHFWVKRPVGSCGSPSPAVSIFPVEKSLAESWQWGFVGKQGCRTPAHPFQGQHASGHALPGSSSLQRCVPPELPSRHGRVSAVPSAAQSTLVL